MPQPPHAAFAPSAASAKPVWCVDDQNWKQAFRERFVVVSDDLFSYLCETCTEVMARIKMQDSTKTVQERGLWYEEAAPVETLFSSVLIANPQKRDAARLFELVDEKIKAPLQIGGSASVGRGLVRLVMKGA